jgi:hypothetical protein
VLIGDDPRPPFSGVICISTDGNRDRVRFVNDMEPDGVRACVVDSESILDG